jgi:hypothetical protein
MSLRALAVAFGVCVISCAPAMSRIPAPTAIPIAFWSEPTSAPDMVLMMLLNSTDLKDANNVVYLARRESAPPVLWYSVNDLGATLGDELLRDLRPEDVAWTCERLAKLTDAQWRDAFAAGGYAPEITDRYVARIKAKIREGLALGALRRAS